MNLDPEIKKELIKILRKHPTTALDHFKSNINKHISSVKRNRDERE